MMNLIASLMNPGMENPPKNAPSSSVWLPLDGSTSAHHVDDLLNFLAWISIISCVGILGAMIWFVFKYRAPSRKEERPQASPDHNTKLEITWSVIPLIIVIGLFLAGFRGYLDLRTSPKDALEIHVAGQKWKWLFTYPNGHVDDSLHVPVDRPVRLIITSSDVLHSVWIPTFRVKQDAVPGRYTDLWFKATKPGDYPLMCTEYCGTSHSDMITHVIVHEPGGYQQWIDSIAEKEKKMDPIALGKLYYKKQGCNTCHSVDGSKLVGPSFKGIYGKPENFADGSSGTVDENYLRESIMEPNAKIVAGYNPAMPTYKGKLKDHQLTGIIEYIKSLK